MVLTLVKDRVSCLKRQRQVGGAIAVLMGESSMGIWYESGTNLAQFLNPNPSLFNASVREGPESVKISSIGPIGSLPPFQP